MITFCKEGRNSLLPFRWLSWMRVRLETRRSRVRPPPRPATFFRGDWSWNIFYGHSLPSADSGRAVVSFWRRMCTILVNRLEDKACPVNVWLGKLTALDMTPLGWLGRKTSTQTKYLLTRKWTVRVIFGWGYTCATTQNNLFVIAALQADLGPSL